MAATVINPPDASEKWLPVVGWEGLYEVSSCGQIRSVLRRKGARFGRILKTCPSSVGYPQVGLKYGAKQWKGHVHTLVCTAFHGPNPGGFDVAHADGTRTNNHACNLRWATRAENVKDTKRHGRFEYGMMRSQAKLTDEIVIAIKYGDIGMSQHALARKLGVDPSTISKIRNDPTKWPHL